MGYFGENGKPSIPDLAFGSTQETRGENGARAVRIAHQLMKRLSAEPEPLLLSLETHRKAIKSWMDASDAWKKRALAAEAELEKTDEIARIWREVAADLEFGGRPYPAQGGPERAALAAKFQKIEARRHAAREAGHPEPDILI